MVKISPLQSCFLQLNHILFRLTWANDLQEKLNQEMEKVYETNNPLEESNRINAQSVMILDYILLNLDQLLEIHDTQLGKVLKEIDFVDLLKHLKNLWVPINGLRGKIVLWRNNYVAHSVNQAINFHSLSEIDPDYNNTIKKTFFASRLATLYISTIFSNLNSDYKIAISSGKLRIELHGGKWAWNDFTSDWEKMKKNERELKEQTDKILQKNGYKPTVRLEFRSVPM
jgi:hypothetical protein